VRRNLERTWVLWGFGFLLGERIVSGAENWGSAPKPRGGYPCDPGPLSLQIHLPERSSPSRVRFAAQNRRALDRSGPFWTTHLEKGKGATAKASSARCTSLAAYAGYAGYHAW